MRKIALFAALFTLSLLSLSAQQITRFAVVDVSRVYNTFYRDSKAVREWEESRNRVQTEINKMKTELQQLQSSKMEAEASGDKDRSLKLDGDISKKSDLIKEYYRVKMLELEDQKKKLSQSGDFMKKIDEELRIVAESDGYSLILRKEADGVLWYSPMVDITDKVIQNLVSKAGK